MQFLHGDFLSVQPQLRSQGVGSLHYQKMLDLMRQDPKVVAFTGEIEAPDEPGLDDETLATRQRRQSFYNALDLCPRGV